MNQRQRVTVASPPISPADAATAEKHRGTAITVLAAEVGASCLETSEIMKDRIKAALRRVAADPRVLSADQREPGHACYARHVLHSDPAGRFTIISIVWGPGQFSPPHAHYAWCAYAVYEGSLEETVYGFDAAASAAKPLCTEVRKPGYSCFAGAGLDQIHRLGNPGTGNAISIHVYGVERDRVATHVNRLVEVSN